MKWESRSARKGMGKEAGKAGQYWSTQPCPGSPDSAPITQREHAVDCCCTMVRGRSWASPSTVEVNDGLHLEEADDDDVSPLWSSPHWPSFLQLSSDRGDGVIHILCFGTDVITHHLKTTKVVPCMETSWRLIKTQWQKEREKEMLAVTLNWSALKLVQVQNVNWTPLYYFLFLPEQTKDIIIIMTRKMTALPQEGKKRSLILLNLV